MKATEVLIDLASRPIDAAERLRPKLSPTTLNAHPQNHDNSVAWLFWHSAREIDAQTADLAGTDQIWHANGFDKRFDLGPASDTIGYGHTAEEARAITTDDADLLLAYLRESTDALVAYVQTLNDADLDDVIDESWDPPVTRGVRIASIIDDAAQHIGPAAYVLGMPL